MEWLPGIIILVFILLIIYVSWAERYHNKKMKKLAEANPELVSPVVMPNGSAPVLKCKCGRKIII